MAFLGFRKWPTPVARPMYPFFLATGVTYYLVSLAQEAGSSSPTFANDPKNPHAVRLAAQKEHH
ncbi:hypothetical protein BOTBODRAFT_107373 [Botryobasidium botryosum FD-172 SS1]|uniref:ATP synthase subunit J, mitochondrial n=1 Tax=Botryobasidium botryosum (strain FD-172 SS1) TaxID=930990 RepID=A0A067MX14_BOTB1|nr:hypothetical protein BOTBODRAFT_107373 [Botryobasidium botryosum FD-172 SS1]